MTRRATHDGVGELRYDPEIGPSYFTLTPNHFLEREDSPSSLARLLYIVLLMHCGRGDTAFPSNERLCKLCSVKSRTTLRAAIKELQDLGLVEVIRRGLTLPNLYIVHKYELVAPKPPHANGHDSNGQNMTISKTDADGQNMAIKLNKRRQSKRSENNQELESVDLDSKEQEDGALNGSEAGAEAGEQARSHLPYSPWIAGVITDLSREMNDLANSSGNVERAAQLWRASGLGEAAFVDLLQQARIATRKAQSGRGVGNKMTYFFQTVADLVGR